MEDNATQTKALLPFEYLQTGDVLKDVKDIIQTARRFVAQNVNVAMIYAYWLVGRRLVVEEQNGKRAKYGAKLLERLSRDLSGVFGDGFTEPNLRNFRIFYQTYPTEEAIRYALSIKLSWTHHRIIMRVADPKARQYYLREAAEQRWSVRVLERNVRSYYYQRILEHQMLPEEGQSTNASKPEALLKDPYVFEFLNIQGDLRGKEKDVETQLIDHLQKFLLELGKGFCFYARQYRISVDEDHFYVDLVFYNYILKCFVLFDLKTTKLTHQDIGQMDMYRRMFDELKRPEGDNPTIGVLLCADVKETVVKYSVLQDCPQLFVSKFRQCMPSEAELAQELELKKYHIEEAKRNAMPQIAESPETPDNQPPQKQD